MVASQRARRHPASGLFGTVRPCGFGVGCRVSVFEGGENLSDVGGEVGRRRVFEGHPRDGFGAMANLYLGEDSKVHPPGRT